MMVLHPLNKKIRPHFLVVIRLSLTFRLHLEEVIRLVRYKEHPSYFYFLKEPQLDTEDSAGNRELKERIDIANAT